MNLHMNPLDNPLTTRQIQMGCGFPFNHTQIDHLELLASQNNKLAIVQFGPGPRPELTVRNPG